MVALPTPGQLQIVKETSELQREATKGNATFKSSTPKQFTKGKNFNFLQWFKSTPEIPSLDNPVAFLYLKCKTASDLRFCRC
ncbi:hypothetical protein H5410_032911 [Solanum commersonii]|uniref:Uncharacterized protein n=1 Tax=Solanum commersonii TaxID=4109 RepID=A0A9J5YNM0_SOLCO|nr:hypothetical protein H5410_032911 [Solanum commersonii]